MNKSFKFDIGEFLQKRMPWVILAVIMAVFSILSPNFLNVTNLVNILNQNSYVLIASFGIALVMMSGNMDLSVGYQMSLTGVLCAMLLTKYNVPAGIVIILAMLISMVFCIFNTYLTIKLRLTLLMVSVGTMTIFQGISFVITDARTYTGFSMAFKFLGQGYIGPVPFPIILMLILFFAMSFFLNKTYLGRYVYALGGNEEASKLAGINVIGVKFMIAMFEGAFIGLATMMLISRVGSAQSTIGPGTEFTVLSGILLGGVSIRGGEGKLSGVVAGILIMAILTNGMQMAGLGTYAQFIAKGAIMLTAIGIDVYQLNKREHAKKTQR